MKEIWVDIKGYEGLYQVSNTGKIKSLNYKRSNKEHFLKLSFNRGKYIKVTLYKNNKLRTFQVHRLVAEAFIPNPKGFPQVNHKDEDKTNNCVYNLEWCTQIYNLSYGTARERMTCTLSKKVYQYNKNNDLLKEWKSVSECGKHGFMPSSVSACCRGERKTHKGFIWRYEKEAE